MRYDFFLAAPDSFFTQSAQGSKARKEVSLRENCLRQMLHLQNEDGIASAHFRPSTSHLVKGCCCIYKMKVASNKPISAFRLSTSHLVKGCCCIYKMKRVANKPISAF
jgi:hypothetical protein